jgi:hypothetical protein
MSAPAIRWRDRVAYVGPWHVATVYHDPHPNRPPWRVACKLPGAVVTPTVMYQSTIDDARTIAGMIVAKWFEMALEAPTK